MLVQKKKNWSLVFFWIAQQVYPGECFAVSRPRVSRAIIGFEWSSKSRGGCSDRRARDESPGFVTLSRFQPCPSWRTPTDLSPLVGVWLSRDSPQITRICLATLTFLAQQISIIPMKSGRGSSAKFVNVRKRIQLYLVCKSHLQCAHGRILSALQRRTRGNCLRSWISQTGVRFLIQFYGRIIEVLFAR